MDRIIDDRDERMWGMLCHLAAFAGLVIPVAGNIVGPLIVYLLKKEEYGFVEDQGKESLNFQITVTILIFISGILVFIGIGLLLMAVVGIAALVFTIIAAIKANEGEFYRYPWSIRFLN
ncbi:DUF4870 domain-containing protein [uncultured Sunxiuqinia sp.]|jgi:uncharacterized protein|uniref:DUF4870 domain-containing protein n=1 Tax=uncultured Sunxiuqinia sp. TaxID=1573825 RepID=UPI0030DD48E0|tara:strand:- start:18030 stop:18386 length:357 start_codon:yes stop_codon:yes gene_type:complete